MNKTGQINFAACTLQEFLKKDPHSTHPEEIVNHSNFQNLRIWMTVAILKYMILNQTSPTSSDAKIWLTLEEIQKPKKKAKQKLIKTKFNIDMR